MNNQFFPFTFVIFGTILLLAFGHKAQAIANNENIYDFRSAEIVLQTIGPMNKTTETVQVGEWGKYEKRHSITKIDAMGFQQEQEQVNYTNRETNINHNYDPKTNKATALNTKKMDDSFKQNNMYYSFDKESLAKFGGEILRNEKYKGLDCVIVEFAQFGSTVWFYKKFPVRTLISMGGMDMATELVSFDERSFSKSDLALPSTAIIGETQDIESIMGKVNAYKNHPDYQEYQNDEGRNVGSEYDSSAQGEMDPEKMKEMQEAMKEAEPEMKKAMEALKNFNFFKK